MLVVAHGNSLRALVKHLDGIGDAAIAELNIPTGIPLVYELDERYLPVSAGGSVPGPEAAVPPRRSQPGPVSRQPGQVKGDDAAPGLFAS